MKAFFVAVLAAIPDLVGGASLPTRELKDIATRHGLPMPPTNAVLVLAHTGGWSLLGNKSTSRDPGIYAPAFLLADKTNQIVVLRGTEQELISYRHRDPLWRPFSLQKPKPRLGGHIVRFNDVPTFVCAVQLALRGDATTSQSIWRQLAAEEWLDSGEFRDPLRKPGQNPELLLAACLFMHFRLQLLQDQPNWPDVHRRMRSLLTEFPALQSPERTNLLQDLELNVLAKEPASNSTAALVLQLARLGDKRTFYGTFDEEEGNTAGPLRREILRRSREAVPDLIALLDDRRLTAHKYGAFMNAPARIQRMGEVAHSLLVEITGLGGNPDAAAFRDWLAKSQQWGEVESLVASVFQRSGGRITEVNEAPARALAEKDPRRLIELCEEFSQHAPSTLQPFALAEALAGARLPLEARVEALARFASRGSLEHQRSVLQCLAGLDGKRTAELLKPILQNLPTDVPGPYWTCPEAALTHVVVQIDDDGIWRDYLKAAKKCSVGLRMEMMNPMNYDYIGSRNQERRLAFLAAFLDDATVRETSVQAGKYEGPCAAFTIPRITVRDFVADKIASVMGLDDDPDEFWTAAQWKALRKKVQEKLAPLKLPSLGALSIQNVSYFFQSLLIL